MFMSSIVRLLCLSVILASVVEGAVPLAQQATDRAFLGISTEPSSETGGIRVIYVFPASAAETMGIKIGDHVILVNDVRVPTPADLSRELRTENVGAKLRLIILRDGKRQRISGKIGSYSKTMQSFQERRRKAMVGKPLPAPPSVTWWNGTTKSWEDKPGALEPSKGRISVVFSFDGCPTCRKERLGRFAKMGKLLEQSAPGSIDFRGLYFKEGAAKKASLTAARELFEAIPTTFPLGVTSYGDAAPTPESRLRNVVLHQHGVAILGPGGNVAYLQIYGYPENEFYNAFKKLYTPEQPAAPGTTGKVQ